MIETVLATANFIEIAIFLTDLETIHYIVHDYKYTVFFLPFFMYF